MLGEGVGSGSTIALRELCSGELKMKRAEVLRISGQDKLVLAI